MTECFTTKTYLFCKYNVPFQNYLTIVFLDLQVHLKLNVDYMYCNFIMHNKGTSVMLSEGAQEKEGGGRTASEAKQKHRHIETP